MANSRIDYKTRLTPSPLFPRITRDPSQLTKNVDPTLSYIMCGLVCIIFLAAVIALIYKCLKYIVQARKPEKREEGKAFFKNLVSFTKLRQLLGLVIVSVAFGLGVKSFVFDDTYKISNSIRILIIGIVGAIISISF